MLYQTLPLLLYSQNCYESASSIILNQSRAYKNSIIEPNLAIFNVLATSMRLLANTIIYINSSIIQIIATANAPII